MAKVLYRKYRPQKFSEVLGQDHIINVLKEAVKAKKISHAYLFSGPRGTGKTTTARLLSSGVGCREYDLVEMDAASSRGIDEIRNLRESVNISPLKSEYKIYIIDEVHMLTKEAFNALLKTLEEPPGHVIFILATTEPEKLPDTITSRCQHFSFKKLSEDLLRKAVSNISKKEGYEVDSEAGSLIALFAGGSFRDALVMLDQILSIDSDKKITGDEARKILSAPSKEYIQGFVTALVEKNSEQGMEIVQKAIEKGIAPQLFLKFILRNIRALLMIKLSPQTERDLGKILGKDEVGFLKTQVSNTTVRDLGYVLTLLLDAYDKTNRAYLPQLPIELVLAKIHLKKQSS